MVLAELGGKLRDSLRKLQSHSSKLTENELSGLLGDITRALIESDVNVKLGEYFHCTMPALLFN
jgi:signal recognition particle subunit SRP54